jgi:hypothetical protein
LSKHTGGPAYRDTGREALPGVRMGDNLLGFGASYRWKVGDYQLNVLKALYLSATYQTANDWNDHADMSVKDLWNDAGVGLYADTVIGLVRRPRRCQRSPL